MGGVTAFLITVAEIVGALVAIIGAMVAFEKWTKGKLTKWLLKSVIDEISAIKNEITELKDHLSKVELDDLKLIIMSEEMPIEERLSAGKRYISQGGNSAVKIHVKLLEEQYEKILRKEEEQ